MKLLEYLLISLIAIVILSAVGPLTGLVAAYAPVLGGMGLLVLVVAILAAPKKR